MYWLQRKSRHSWLRGCLQAGKSTKKLLRSLNAKQMIIVIQHSDLDEMAAAGIVEAKVKAVINAAPTMTGKYPAKGAKLLLDAKIPLFEIHPSLYAILQKNQGEQIAIRENTLILESDNLELPCYRFNYSLWEKLNERANHNLSSQLQKFVDNTLSFASKEKDLFVHSMELPQIKTWIEDRHVVVVVRGSEYKNDLKAIRQYIAECKPILIGVDGGADALLENHYQPDMIIGDMDSISDKALLSGAELIVHAYLDGNAPGLERIKKLGKSAEIIRAPGTSEDVAMLLAYEKKAKLIVTIGTHTHMIDFLEKGRKGMSSTVLARMKIGAKLVDAKGVSLLYKPEKRLRALWLLPIACLFPLLAIAWIHPGTARILHLLHVYFKLLTS